MHFLLYIIKINDKTKGTTMKSGFFYRRDEIVLSTATALVVMGLLHLGFSALYNGKIEHAMFQKGSGVTKK